MGDTGGILLLESDKDSREHFQEIFSTLRTDIPVTIVGTVKEALDELSQGTFERFRANFINDDAEYPDAILYAEDALREAVRRGVTAEIWTGSDFYEVVEVLREYAQDLDGSISIYSKGFKPTIWFTDRERAFVKARGLEEGLHHGGSHEL